MTYLHCFSTETELPLRPRTPAPLRYPRQRTSVTPDLHLSTLFLLDGYGRIMGTREPEPRSGPLFVLIRGETSCVWAVRADVPQALAEELESSAQDEPPTSDFRSTPLHAERYVSLIKGEVDSGPAFKFPEEITLPQCTVFIEDIRLLDHHFTGWTEDEIPERTPIVGVVGNGFAVSVCCCSRRSDVAAEAGIETAEVHRGRGRAPRVTAAWALAVRSSGRIPLYSTSWSNHASLAVARKLGLVAYASVWNVSEV